ncbi:site-specific integrase [Haloarculaceae archaeon H-GB11]|nr:site-specific integrase [Haloarculaceae archaeon H-GB11]
MTRGPRELKPREAWRRYVNHRRPEATDRSTKTYHYRIKQFVEWCEDEQIEQVSELNGWLFDQYENKRRGDGLAPATLSGEMQDLKQFAEYLESIEAIDDDLAEKVNVPRPSREDQMSDAILEPDRGIELVHTLRNDPTEYGSRTHVFFEIVWMTGARLGGLRALDVRDFNPDEGYVSFRHRQSQDTPLKNKKQGERPVSIPQETVDVIQTYLTNGERWDKHDDHGRRPLLTTRQGRPGHNTVRAWAYQLTLPCKYWECPHEKDPDTCEWTGRNTASKCPSSRSPHPMRSGSITWQLNRGLPPEVVAARVNADPKIIELHYDQATQLERMKRRRQQYVPNLEVDYDED